MNSLDNRNNLLTRMAVGLIAGAGIAAVDNFAFGGEASPIMIVGMLLIVAGAAGTIWGVRAAVVAALVWVWLPLAHVVKHMFDLPDTLHPNTYGSILKLATFSFVVATIGFGLGLMLHRLVRKTPA